MARRIVIGGRINKGIEKSNNIAEIIKEINTMNIKKEMKEILFLTSMTIVSPIKTTDGIIHQLEFFKSKGEISPNYSFDKYIKLILKDVKKIEIKEFNVYIDKLIKYVDDNKVKLY